jgi:hypothetical protein
VRTAASRLGITDRALQMRLALEKSKSGAGRSTEAGRRRNRVPGVIDG